MIHATIPLFPPQAYLGSLVGVGDSYYSNMASLFAFTSGIFKNNSYSDVLEINDTEIFGVNVRIYKPLIKTRKSVGNIAHEERLLPGVIYFHGGGWTVGTLGKSSVKVKTLMSNGFICKEKDTLIAPSA